MNIQEVPLSPNNQQFSIALGDVNLQLTLVWRDAAGWILDILDSTGIAILSGAPLVPGVNLLAQYPTLGINGVLSVVSDDESEEYPTKTNLGIDSHLYFLQE